MLKLVNYIQRKIKFLKKNDVKDMKYLVVHLYPDDTIEIITSLNWPNPTEKGLKWQERIKKEWG